MKIGLFTDTYLPDVNGVCSSIETLRLALTAHGHEVWVVCPDSTVKGVKMDGHVLRIHGARLSFLYGYTLAGTWNRQAFERIRKWHLDIIHVHTEFGIGLFARAVSRKLNIPIVSTYHTFYEDYTHYVNLLHSSAIEKLARRAVRKLSVYYTGNVRRVIVPTVKTKERLADYGVKTEMTIIPTGLDLEAFRQGDPEIIGAFGEGVFTIIYVGRLAEEKSVDMIVDAMEMLKGEQYGLLIAGDGPDYDKLRRYVTGKHLDDAVHFAGRIPHDHISGYYRHGDVFVSASLSETQGMTFIEAMACGIPVLARDRVALEGVLHDGENGYYFNDAEDLADKIRLLRSHPDIASMKQRSEQIASQYSLDSFAAMAEQVYREVIEESHEQLHR